MSRKARATDELPIALVVNPKAGRVRRRDLVRDPFWQRHLPEAAVFVTADLAGLDAALCRLRARRPAVIACLGGDGSLHHLLAAALRHYGPAELPVVLPLAGGTVNGLAHAVGTGGPPEALLAAALARAREGAVPGRRLALLEIREAGGEVRRGFTLAAGLAARAVAHYDRRGARGA